MDTELVVRAQDGDRVAFAAIADGVFDRFRAVAHGILRDRELAEDATQQALLSVWTDLPSLRDPARFDAWSHRLLIRACHAEHRRSRRPQPFLPGEPTAEEELRRVVDRDQLERGFRRLSVDQRAVIVLRHHLDLPLDQVAHTLGIPAGTVRSRLHRAISSLRASLEADARPVHAVPLRRDVGRMTDERDLAGKGDRAGVPDPAT